MKNKRGQTFVEYILLVSLVAMVASPAIARTGGSVRNGYNRAAAAIRSQGAALPTGSPSPRPTAHPTPRPTTPPTGSHPYPTSPTGPTSPHSPTSPTH